MSQSTRCGGLLTVCSLFWLGPVTNQVLPEEIARDHVFVPRKPVPLQSFGLWVVYWEGKVGSKIEEKYNNLTWAEQRHRRTDKSSGWFNSHVLAGRADASDFYASGTADDWNVLFKSHVIWNHETKVASTGREVYVGSANTKWSSIWLREESLCFVAIQFQFGFAPKHACKHEAHPPWVYKKKSSILIQMILVLFELVLAAWSVIKQTFGIIWVFVTNLLLFEHQQKTAR